MSVDFFCLFFVIHVDFALGYYIKQINGHITSQKAYCSLRNEMERNEMERNEMEICSLRNENL